MIIHDINTSDFAHIQIYRNNQNGSSEQYIDRSVSDQSLLGQQPYVGQLRYVYNWFEVWTGYGWVSLPKISAQIELTHSARQALSVVHEQEIRSQRIRQLVSSNPALQIALDRVEQAERVLEVVYQLVSSDSQYKESGSK